MPTSAIEKITLTGRRVKDNIFEPSQWFFDSEVTSSALLLFASMSAIYWANSFLSPIYNAFLHTGISLFAGDYRITRSAAHWINEGLMTLFFFTVGLEIKREVLVGELASVKKAMLPVIAAVGGMIVPAFIYLAFNHGTPEARGWGMAISTDIAFSLGAIALFGRDLPVGLRIFLAAFAIADDLGAVLVIAVFYAREIAWNYVIAGGHMLLGLVIANILLIRKLPVYVVLGAGLWIAAMGSGIHPTIAGLLAALFIPARGKYNTLHFLNKIDDILTDFNCHEQSCDHKHDILLNTGHLNAVQTLEMACHNVQTPLQRFEHVLQPWVAFLILPLFAFANAGISFSGMTPADAAVHPVTLGTALGLFIGKPVGITLFAYLAVILNLAELPENVCWSHIIGAGMLGGIGFTMSLFISGLAFSSADVLDYSKLGILGGSILSIAAGSVFLSVYAPHGGGKASE